MSSTRRALAAALIAMVTVAGTAGCSAKQAVKTVIEQGVEPTSTGAHNTAPANNADNAVQGLNNSIQQTQQDAQSGQ